MTTRAKVKAAILGDGPERCRQVYGQGRLERLAQVADLVPGIVTGAQLAARAGELDGVEAVFSTWGLPRLGPEQLARLPALRILFYAAGSVKGFAPGLLERGIRVVSSWGANAVPVAEFALAQILLSCKGYFRNTRAFTGPGPRLSGGLPHGPGVFGETVGLIGCGMVARALIELLRHFQVRVVVHDPFLDEDEARRLSVERVSLPELFARSLVVSNHLPNLPELRGVLDGALFECLRPGATFINTGRGAQVVEADLIRVLRARPDVTALLDVTDPEPPAALSPLYELPNAQVSSHIAGALGDEVVRLADSAIEEFLRWERGEPLRWEVTAPMLARMA